MTDIKLNFKRGEIYWMYFNKKEGSSRQSGWRPGIIVDNDLAVKHATVFHCIPITTQIKRLDLPVHVELHSGGLEKKSMALVESEDQVDVCDIKYKIGRLSQEDMDEIDFAMMVQKGLNRNTRLLNRLMRYNNYQFA